eukprot:Skav203731  [mRNA]  locus=scaffold4858:8450:8668:+ [translate_table: standard]
MSGKKSSNDWVTKAQDVNSNAFTSPPPACTWKKMDGISASPSPSDNQPEQFNSKSWNKAELGCPRSRHLGHS